LASIFASIRGSAMANGMRGRSRCGELFISVPMQWLVRPSPAGRLASGVDDAA
jgi:hypothetical protein